MKSFLEVESWAIHSAAQWWLVMTKPVGDTTLPEQPSVRRTDESRTCSSHSLVGAKPYRCRRRSDGKSSTSHIPSSEGKAPLVDGVDMGGAADLAVRLPVR